MQCLLYLKRQKNEIFFFHLKQHRVTTFYCTPLLPLRAQQLVPLPTDAAVNMHSMYRITWQFSKGNFKEAGTGNLNNDSMWVWLFVPWWEYPISTKITEFVPILCKTSDSRALGLWPSENHYWTWRSPRAFFELGSVFCVSKAPCYDCWPTSIGKYQSSWKISQ